MKNQQHLPFFLILTVICVSIFFFLTPGVVSAHTGGEVTVCDANVVESKNTGNVADDYVNLADYTLMIGYLLSPFPEKDAKVDITHDGVVDLSDISLLRNFFSQKCEHHSPGTSLHSVPKPMDWSTTKPLVDKYHYKSTGQHGHIRAIDVAGMTYKPRQYTQDPFKGWDHLLLPTGTQYGFFRTYTDNEWLYINLNRSARVAVVWNGSKTPVWLAGWEKGPLVGGRQSWLKTFPAGQAVLGAIGGTENNVYDVLLAEANGQPSQAPAVPQGKAVPVANQTCPAWVHDQYATQGPDGKYYRTWHQQIDPTYWCYFHHEHGSNPQLFGDGTHQVPFGYVTDRSDHFDAHEGFKIWAMKNKDRVTNREYDVLFEVHFGTARPERSCQRHHATTMYVADAQTNELLTKLTFVGDYGIAFKNGDIETEERRIKCPNLSMSMYGDGPGQTRAVKKARVAPGNSGYENWRLGVEKVKLGFVNSGGLTFDTFAPLTAHGGFDCSWSTPGDPMTISCGTPVMTGSKGIGRFLSMNSNFHFSANQAIKTGKFYTDEYGEVLRQATDPDATEQFIKPGTEIRLSPAGTNSTGQQSQIFTNDPWDMEFLVTNVLEISTEFNIENQIRTPN